MLDITAVTPANHQPAIELDTAVYTDRSRHTAELAMLRRHPALVAHSSDLPTEGSFITRSLWGVPIIVSRDGHGVHAVVNACAHRGATLMHEPCGTARVLSCPFHGWSYRLDGSLRSISERERFGEAPDGVGLEMLACEERHGLIWVVADPAIDEIDLRGWLTDPLDDLFTDLGMATMVCHQRATYDLACNWKMITDGFLETYHLKYLHRASIAPYFPSNMFGADRFGPHFVGYLPKNRLLKQFEERPRDEWEVLDHLTMSTTLVPGSVIQWQAGHVEVFALRPDLEHPNRCQVELSMLVPADRFDDIDLWNRNWSRLVNTIPAEDFVASEDVQSNIDAGIVRRLLIGATEHRLVDHITSLDAL